MRENFWPREMSQNAYQHELTLIKIKPHISVVRKFPNLKIRLH